MGQSIAISAMGMLFEVEDPDNEDTWVSIGGIKTITRTETAPTVNDETVLTSEGKEKSIGMLDYGQIGFEGQYNRADDGQIILQDAKVNQTQLNVRVTFADGTTENGTGWVLTFPWNNVGVGNTVSGTMTMELTGTTTWS